MYYGAHLTSQDSKASVYTACAGKFILDTSQKSAQKSDLRQAFRARRRAVDQKEREAAARAVIPFFLDLLIDHAPRCIALYVPIDGELSCHPIFELCIRRGIQVVFPHVEEERLSFYTASTWDDACVIASFKPTSELATGVRNTNAMSLDEIDMMLVPGVVFDHRGHRIGFGKGFYDRVLSHYSGFAIGLGYAFQRILRVPEDVWDQALLGVLTECGFHVSSLVTPHVEKMLSGETS